MIIKEKMYTLKETAEFLGVSKNTLRLWDNNGSFKSSRTNGNHRRYSGKSILEKQENMKREKL